MYETDYRRAASIEDAIEAVRDAADGKFLAGGHTLVPTMKQRLAAPDRLVDIWRIEALKGIEVAEATVKIGAATTHATVAASPELGAALPAVAHLASMIGDPHVRARGTMGGSVANNDPAADYPAAVLGLDATVMTDRRQISAADYFQGLFETSLEPDELITAIEFKRPTWANYQKLRNPASRYAVVGVMLSVWADGKVHIAVTGAGNDGVFRWTDAENLLNERFETDQIDHASIDASELQSDIHASNVYRAGMIAALTKKAVQEILAAESGQ